jgi:hypothetical protein
MSLYGGALFAVLFGSRDSTKEIVHPGDLARELAAQVARERNLPEAWLNDDVRCFLADNEAKRKLKGDEFGPGLQVSVPTAAYLLAMKLRACRAPQPGYGGDREDIRFLVRKMDLSSLADVERIHDRFFPRDTLSDAAIEVVRQALAERKDS